VQLGSIDIIPMVTSNAAKMPLAMVETGRVVRLVEITAGKKLKTRLADMGLFPGMEFTVMKNTMGGPFIIAVKESRIAIGRGMAQKIMVE
jgi:ferrous iron transport protein A